MHDKRALWIIAVVVGGQGVGLAIGNLTSQICANIYLHEYDRYVRYVLQPSGYVRYGDDMVLWVSDKRRAQYIAEASDEFLATKLHLSINLGVTVVQPVRTRLHYIGMRFWPAGHRLDKRMRLHDQVNIVNFTSYEALARSRGTKAECHMLREAMKREFDNASDSR